MTYSIAVNEKKLTKNKVTFMVQTSLPTYTIVKTLSFSQGPERTIEMYMVDAELGPLSVGSLVFYISSAFEVLAGYPEIVYLTSTFFSLEKKKVVKMVLSLQSINSSQKMFNQKLIEETGATKFAIFFKPF